MDTYMTEQEAKAQADRLESAVASDTSVTVMENHETDGYHVEIRNSFGIDALYSPAEIDNYIEALKRQHFAASR